MFGDAYDGARVLVTGHTGFKGSWLALWLAELGAEVAGYSVDVPTEPSNFAASGLERWLHEYRADIRDRDAFARALDEFRPHVVFHLAAQSLVRRSYNDPVETFEVNALGTLNVLECARRSPWLDAAVLVTSDKCYRNVEWVWGYRETDTLGGKDPYSGSKACAELVFYSYARSFFDDDESAPRVSTARAGNVIGGGDWADDRLVPDCVRAWSRGDAVVLRSPHATRPWQHVLEPLSGYLWLGSRLRAGNGRWAGTSYNFGPPPDVTQDVVTVVGRIAEAWPGAEWRVADDAAEEPAEATLLKLSCDKALAELGWHSVLTFDETVELTARWYRAFYEDDDMAEICRRQIGQYADRAKSRGLPWTASPGDGGAEP